MDADDFTSDSCRQLFMPVFSFHSFPLCMLTAGSRPIERYLFFVSTGVQAMKELLQLDFITD